MKRKRKVRDYHVVYRAPVIRAEFAALEAKNASLRADNKVLLQQVLVAQRQLAELEPRP